MAGILHRIVASLEKAWRAAIRIAKS